MFFSASDAKPSLEVRGVFLKLYKAFDRVWHDGLLYKIMSNGIDGNFFKLIKSFLNSRCQQIVLNGQSSVWKLVTTHVLQSLVLGPLFVLICINDLPPGLTTNVKLFADDTSLFSVVNNASLSASRLSNDLEKTQDRAFAKEVTFSKKKKKKILVLIIPYLFHNPLTEQDTTQNHLGLKLGHQLTFQYHLNKNIKKP